MKKFEYFPTTADVGVCAYGRSMEEVFENAALGMFGVMCSPAKVRCEVEKEVSVEADNTEELLVKWLTALLGMRDIHGMMFSKFKVVVRGKYLRGTACGEETKEEHELASEVKAVTYHMIEVKKNKIWKARFILDV